MPERKIQLTVLAKDASASVFKGLGSAIGTVVKTVGALAAAGVAAIGGLAAVSVTQAISVESAFAGVIKTTDGLTDSTGALTTAGLELRNQFRDLSKEVPTTVEELMHIGELGGQLGVQKDNLIEFTRTIAAMGEATNLSTEEAASQFAQLANIMGTSQEDFDRMGSSIVALGNNMATTEADISAFASRIAGAGKIAGLTEADVFGIAAAFSSVGIEAEAGGTATQKVLMSMNAAVAGNTGELIDNTKAIGTGRANLEKLQQQLAIATQKQAEFTDKTKLSTRMAQEARIDNLTQQIQDQTQSLGALAAAHGRAAEGAGDLETFAKTAGMSAEEFKAAWEDDAAGAFSLFVQGLGAAGDDAMGILADLGMEDQRLMRSFLSLGNAGTLVNDAIALSNEAWAENTALSKEAAQRYATTESMISMLKNTFKDFAVTAGDALLPFLRDTITDLQPFLADFGERLPELLNTYVIPALEDLVEIGGNVVEFITTFVGKLQEGADPLTAFKDSLSQLLPPETAERIGNIVTKISEFATFVITNAPTIGAAFVGIGVAFGVMQAILVGAQVVSAIGAIVAAINPVTLIIAGVILVLGLLAAAWTGNWGGIRDTLTEVWTNTLQPALQSIWDWLSVNIPKAISTVSEFWTGTLLPAIKDVWAFINDNLGPLFKALVDVELAALQVILVTLSELWKNVFQPAIENVAKVFTETVLPALKDVWSWFAEKLTPASSDANDIIDKLAKGVGNFATGALKKATEWLGNLADKLKKAGEAVPKVFMPGSPTPFELGLRGIADALVDAGRGFFEFTKSVSADDAKNFKDMASGLKQLGQALEVIVGIQAKGGGGGFDIGAMLANFGAVVMQALDEIAKLDAVWGEKTIKKLDKDATRLARILDAVMKDLSGIKVYPLPDLAGWGGQIRMVFGQVMAVVSEVRNEFGEKAIKRSAEIADSVSGVLGLIKPAIDALVALSGYKPLESLSDQIVNLRDRLLEVVPALTYTAEVLASGALSEAAAIYQSIQTIVGVVKPAIEAITALAEWEPVQSLGDKGKEFTARVLEIADALKTAATGLDTTGYENAGKFWTAAQGIIGVVKPGVEAITALFEWEPVGSLRSKGMEFAWAVQDIAFALQLAAAGLEATGLEAASVFWAAAKGIIEVVKPGVEAIKDLVEWQTVGDLTAKTADFGANVLEIVRGLTEVPQGVVLPDISEEMIAFWDKVKKILSTISPGAEALKKLGEYAAVGNLPALIATFRTQIETVILELVKLPASLRISMGDADSDPDVLFGPIIAFMTALEPVFESMKKALDVFKALGKLTTGGDDKIPSVSASMTFFSTAMQTLVTTLGTTASTLEAEGISEATRFYNVASRIADAVRGGMNLIATMAEEGVRGAPEMLQTWLGLVGQMVASLGALSGGGLSLPALPAMAGAGAMTGGDRATVGGGAFTLKLNIHYQEPSGAYTDKVVDIVLSEVDEYMAEVEV